MKRRFMTILLLLVSTAPAWALTSGDKRSNLMGGAAAVVSATVANYFPVQGDFTPAAAAAEGNVQLNAALPMQVGNMRCVLVTAGGVVTVAGGTSYVIAFRDNGTDTAITCTILAGASSCSDTTHQAAVAAQDLIDYEDTPAGTPTVLEPKCSIEADY